MLRQRQQGFLLVDYSSARKGQAFDPETMNRHKEMLLLLIPFCVVAPAGGWWAIYQCIRREQHPVKYLAIVILVPLGFVWYYFGRYRRSCGQSDSVAAAS